MTSRIVEEEAEEESHLGENGASFLLHSNLRIFSKAMSALGKLGSDLYLEPSKHGLSLRSFNKTKSAYGIFLFSNDFFSEVDSERLSDNHNMLCRLSMKCALAMFKGIIFTDKNFISFKLWVNPNSNKLIVEIVHAYDIVRTLEIHIMENRAPFKTSVDKSTLSNITVASSDVLMSILSLLHCQGDELILSSSEEEFVFKNFSSREEDEQSRLVKTEAHIRIGDIIRHTVAFPTDICFCTKEFMSILTFASQHQCPVSLYYDQPGKPLVVALEGDVNYTAEFIISTFESSYAGVDETMMEVRKIHSGEKSASTVNGSDSRKTSENNKATNDRPAVQVAQVCVQNPFPTPTNTTLAPDNIEAQQEPIEENISQGDIYIPNEENYQQDIPEEENNLMQNLGFDFNASQELQVHQPPSKTLEKSRSKRDIQFRRFFLNAEQATQQTTKVDDSIIAYDSFDDDM